MDCRCWSSCACGARTPASGLRTGAATLRSTGSATRAGSRGRRTGPWWRPTSTRSTRSRSWTWARGPIVLRHPNLGRRYVVFQFLDPYTNTIGYVGTRATGRRAGRFAISWTKRPGRRVRGVRVIRSRYRRLWMIGRTLASTPADQRRARRLMRRYALIPLRRLAKGPIDYPRRRPGKPREATTPQGLAFLEALGTALQRNPPPARDRPILRAAGHARHRPRHQPGAGGAGAAGARRARGGRASGGRGATRRDAQLRAGAGAGGQRLVHLAAAHRRLRHRLPAQGAHRRRGPGRQHARGGHLPGRHHRRLRGAARRLQAATG